MTKKIRNFADDYDDEPISGALAFTDFTKPVPILEGEDAERFIRNMEENERKAAERAKIPMTKDEAEENLSYTRIIYELEKDRLKEIEDSIKKLEEYISKL